MNPSDLEKLRETLAQRERVTIHDPDAFVCAVLVPFLETKGRLEILYTLRSDDLPSHRGQVAFPGGKRDPNDADLRHTALRETHEEVGIPPSSVEVLGALDDVTTMMGKYVITPFVARIASAQALTLNPGEVADAFTVPVDKLVDPAYRDSEERVFDGTEYTINSINAGPHMIWGVTHTITLDLLEHIKRS